jgi:hypothetical protein
MPPLQDPEVFATFFLDYSKSYLRALSPAPRPED